VIASTTPPFGPIVLLATITAVYVVRWRRVGGSAGRLALFLGGVAALGAALLGPVDRLAAESFTMHMVQHVLLLDIAPILLLLGTTKVILRPVTRRLLAIERAAGPVAHPVFAVAAYVAVIWVWHVPGMYVAALESAYVHAIEHLTFSAVGMLYWWHLVSPLRNRLRFGGMQPVMYMVSTKVLVGLLGIVLTFSPATLYPFYEEQRAGVFGLDPASDQAVAGAFMALEQAIVMGIALAWLFINALGESEREEQRAERHFVG
jgi:putative membrane protein